MQRGTDGVPDECDSASVARVDPTVTLSLLVAILEAQRRTNLALFQLLRGMNGSRRPSLQPTRSATIAHARAFRRVDRQALQALLPRALEAVPHVEVPTRARGPRLQVRCFGRFEVVRDGVPIDHWRRGKAKTLLKHLIVRRQPVSRDVLIDLLWPDSDPQTAVNGLRVALHALRQALGPCQIEGSGVHDYVTFESGNYAINPATALWVDADEFSSHFTTARRLDRQGQPRAAIEHYEQAEAVYRDDYLIEDLYEDWTLVRREELKDQYLMALTKLADTCAEEGDAEGCIVRCHKILQKDPCREDAYRRLMRCYAQLDQPSQALHWFELCARTLRQELDVAPSEQTMDLYRRISAGKQVNPTTAGISRRHPLYRADRSTGREVVGER